MKLDKNNPIPLYYQLSELLKEQIEAGAIAHGDKLPSEADMLKQYDIGRMTIRNALSRLVNMGYLVKEHGRGTFCSYVIDSDEGKRLDIDVILSLDDEYFIHYYVKAISNVLSSYGYNFIIHDSKNDTNHICSLLNSIADKGSSGVIVQPSHFTCVPEDEVKHVFKRLARRNIPCIMINASYECVENASYLVLDEHAGAAAAAQHLISRGHKRTGVVFIDEFRIFLDRRDGYINAFHQKADLPPIAIPVVDKMGFEKEFIGTILRHKLTAVFCASDSLARSCVEYLNNVGIKVPEDFSVVGYDDSLVAEVMVPQLTSVAHPKQALGEMAAHALIDKIHDKGNVKPFKHVFLPKLTLRESTAQRI